MLPIKAPKQAETVSKIFKELTSNCHIEWALNKAYYLGWEDGFEEYFKKKTRKKKK